MKREFLAELLPEAPREVLSRILDEHGRELAAQKAALGAMTEERDTLRQALADGTPEEAQRLRTELSALQSRYQRDTQALQQELSDAAYRSAVREAGAGLAFSSQAARRGFEEALLREHLPLENGALTGLHEFTEAARKADPGAFAPEGRVPVFTRAGSTEPAPQGSALRAAFGLPND